MIEVLKTVAELRAILASRKCDGETVGLVPTMGALHEGHLSLIRRSVGENACTVVSIFVNPTQFGPGEDLDKYPRQFAADLELCDTEKADVVFAPTPEEMYPRGFGTFVEVEGLGQVLCGASRPTHFRGVMTVCAKLFGIVQPDRAYFGEKDYQQLIIIRRMVADLNMPVKVIGCPIVRESSGLALSSRNSYLTEDERKQAPVLHHALLEAKRLVEAEGVTDASDITTAMTEMIASAPAAKIDYVAVVDAESLEPLEAVTGKARALVAVYFGKARLIDNMDITGKGVKSYAETDAARQDTPRDDHTD